MDFQPYFSSSAGNLYLCSSEGHPGLAIDPGVRMAEVRKALSFGVTKLAGALVSHSHQDHCHAVPDFLRSGVDCYASAGTWEALGLDGHRAHAVQPLQEVQVGAWAVLPFEAQHDTEGALGFLVGAPDGDRLVYLCDSAYVSYRFRGVTHWALECNYSAESLRRSSVPPERKARVLRSHLGLERVVDLLKANDLTQARQIWILHLSAEHGDGETFRQVIQRETGKPVYVAPRNVKRE